MSEKLPTCPVCNKAFDSVNELLDHLLVEADDLLKKTKKLLQETTEDL